MMTTFVSILALASSIALILVVAMQEGAKEGYGTLTAAQPLWGANKGTSREDVLRRITVIAAIVFMVSHIALLVIK